MRGEIVPKGSAVHSCTAIGYTDRKSEDWFSHKGVRVECVGIPSYLGTTAPRVAGLIRFGKDFRHDPLKFVHGNVLDPKGPSKKIICQLVNDQARFWGGGVAKSTSRKFPEAQKDFSNWITTIPRSKRLGMVHFAEVTGQITVASLVGQEGFGESTSPRIRYAALEQCFERVLQIAAKTSASIHMPRLGAGQSGGQWETVEEIIRSTFVPASITVTIYDLPPKSVVTEPRLFD
jgi:O-acetyl-ADP-ribose deacetylase (regulator of RNase III)